MQWWVWLIIVVVVVALAVLAFGLVQARRRSGGAISTRDQDGAGGGS